MNMKGLLIAILCIAICIKKNRPLLLAKKQFNNSFF